MSNELYRNSGNLQVAPERKFEFLSSNHTCTDYILHGIAESVFNLIRHARDYTPLKSPIKLYYTLHSDIAIAQAEQRVIADFVQAWNTFAVDVNSAVKDTRAALNTVTATLAESIASPNLTPIRELGEVEFITTDRRLPTFSSVSSTFDEYRGLIVSIAAESLGCLNNRSLSVAAQADELNTLEIDTLNILGNLILGSPVVQSIHGSIHYEMIISAEYDSFPGIDEFKAALTQFPRRILAARNGLLLAEDHPEVTAKVAMKARRIADVRKVKRK